MRAFATLPEDAPLGSRHDVEKIIIVEWGSGLHIYINLLLNESYALIDAIQYGGSTTE